MTAAIAATAQLGQLVTFFSKKQGVNYVSLECGLEQLFSVGQGNPSRISQILLRGVFEEEANFPFVFGTVLLSDAAHAVAEIYLLNLLENLRGFIRGYYDMKFMFIFAHSILEVFIVIYVVYCNIISA
jgi:hypothetical protein